MPSLQTLRMASWIAGIESGMIVVVEMVQLEDPRSVKTCDKAGMHLSVDGSLEAVSEMIRIAAVNLGCGDAIVLVYRWDYWKLDDVKSRVREAGADRGVVAVKNSKKCITQTCKVSFLAIQYNLDRLNLPLRINLGVMV